MSFAASVYTRPERRPYKNIQVLGWDNGQLMNLVIPRFLAAQMIYVNVFVLFIQVVSHGGDNWVCIDDDTSGDGI